MKNRLQLQVLLLTFISMIGLSLNAQSSDKDKPARIGVRAGWHYAGMFKNNEMLPGTEHSNAFYVGIFKEKKLIPILRIGSGLEYFENGYKINDNAKREIHTISIPLYLKVKIGPVYATGGTGFNFIVSEKLPGSLLLDPLNNKETDFYDMPLQLGAGIKIFMFSVEARYNWGMFDVNGDASNQYLQVGFTVSF